MHRIQHTLTITLFLVVLGNPVLSGATEFAVPNNGSPYKSLSELETGQILHLPTGVVVTQKQLMDTVSTSRVIYIGETHDNLEAHRVQMEIIRDLHARYPGKVAVGMEMFRRPAQNQLDLWHEGKLTDRQFRKLFRENWGLGIQLYRPIFDYLKAQRIPLLGLKSGESLEQRLREGGLEQEGLPDIDADDPYHRAYSMALFGGHASHSTEGFHPYHMLLLWEESMAEAVAEFLTDDRYPDWKLVVLAGGFHVQYGYGIPKRAFRRVPHAYSIVLPTVTEIPTELKDREMKFESTGIPLYSADFGWKLDYVVPPPLRIRLGVYLEDHDDGLRVVRVMPNSNAERMGLKKNDLIQKLNGIRVVDTEELTSRLQQHDFGETVRVHVMRDEREVQVEGVLQQMTEPHTE
ncbi:ChaN family lipoprotein [Nitrospina watsonii]|uniref:PDZ domain-containing protein n=1 Tax=Nitrospina watsonii TaxID=1323948 RepID=A0ABM9HAY5_9BACT|nr:ChaN family lipoprotein [Nitrospina watsonii]CAI2717284.1 PDZ domain-containing protein [Nitrospina watsonii]